MSPELFVNFCQKKSAKHGSPSGTQKYDCWSIGAVLLTCGVCDRNVQEIYDRKRACIDQDKLDYLLDIFKDRYLDDNSLLCDIVEALLIVDEDRREFAGRLISEVPSFEEILAHYAVLGGQNQVVDQRPEERYPEMIQSCYEEIPEAQYHEVHQYIAEPDHEVNERIVKADGLGNSGHSPQLHNSGGSPYREPQAHTMSPGRGDFSSHGQYSHHEPVTHHQENYTAAYVEPLKVDHGEKRVFAPALYTPAYSKDPRTGRLVKNCMTDVDNYCNENPLFGSYYQNGKAPSHQIQSTTIHQSVTTNDTHYVETHFPEPHCGNVGENLVSSPQKVSNVVHSNELPPSMKTGNITYGKTRVLSTTVKRVDAKTGQVLSEEVVDGDHHPDAYKLEDYHQEVQAQPNLD